MTLQTSNSLEILSNKRLSVQISLTGLSFLVTNLAKTKVLHFSEIKYKNPRTPEELLLDIANFFSEEISSLESLESLRVIYANSEYSCVPAPLFDETKAGDYLKFNSKILIDDFISWDTVESRDLNVVYVPYVNINNYLLDTYGSFEYYHSTTVLLELLKRNRFSETATVHLHVRTDNFDVVIQEHGNLLLCNTYHYKTPEDFIYYVLFCFEQLELNPETTKVVLMGAIIKGDDLYDIAFNYIRHISFFEDSGNELEITDTSDYMHILLKNL